jgi:hypothetical protein
MGRLSAYAKNRILKLRFKKNKRIIHIVDILKRDDNIKVSRQAVSTFLKKYLETNSIYDKPRTGRKRKLTQEEIQLIGQVTRLNRDITARAIKEYLNLNVSTYTILRATKLFEWNKINPNSNDSKKAAALERQMNGEIKRRRSTSTSSATTKRQKKKSGTKEEAGSSSQDPTAPTNAKESTAAEASQLDESGTTINGDAETKPPAEGEQTGAASDEGNKDSTTKEKNKSTADKSLLNSSTANNKHEHEIEKINLNLIPHKELATLKNLSCSPMSFATKILFKIFKIEELHGHNVSGKTLNKNLKAKLPLDPVRIGYIKYLVEAYYDEKECREMLSGAISHKQDLWKSCHTAINKSILISERKAAAAVASGLNPNDTSSANKQNDSTASALLNGSGSADGLHFKSTMNVSTSEFDDSDGMIRSKKKSLANKSRVGLKKGLNKLSSSKKLSPKKRSRRFDLSISSSSGDEFDADLQSEEIDTNGEGDGNDSDDSNYLKKLNKKLSSSKKEKEASNRRRSLRAVKPKKKPDAYDFSDDSESDNDGLRFRLPQGQGEDYEGDEDEDDEIELIQNIEKRLTNATNASLKLPVNTFSNRAHINTNHSSIYQKHLSAQQQQQSSEAQAASNIAAAMKKRLISVAPNEQSNSDDIFIDDEDVLTEQESELMSKSFPSAAISLPVKRFTSIRVSPPPSLARAKQQQLQKQKELEERSKESQLQQLEKTQAQQQSQQQSSKAQAVSKSTNARQINIKASPTANKTKTDSKVSATSKKSLTEIKKSPEQVKKTKNLKQQKAQEANVTKANVTEAVKNDKKEEIKVEAKLNEDSMNQGKSSEQSIGKEQENTITSAPQRRWMTRSSVNKSTTSLPNSSAIKTRSSITNKKR